MDISQSVLLSFFVRTAAGQYELEEPEQLLKLLVTMARNKLASAARHEHQKCRDRRRTTTSGAAGPLAHYLDPLSAPDEQIAARELLVRLRQALSDDERRLADLRSQGVAWTDIATQLGGTAQARRIQLARAIDRVARQFDLDLAEG
jgi:hypothetical protein